MDLSFCIYVLMAQTDAYLIVSWYAIERDLQQLQCSIKMRECHVPCVSMLVLDFNFFKSDFRLKLA